MAPRTIHHATVTDDDGSVIGGASAYSVNGAASAGLALVREIARREGRMYERGPSSRRPDGSRIATWRADRGAPRMLTIRTRAVVDMSGVPVTYGVSAVSVGWNGTRLVPARFTHATTVRPDSDGRAGHVTDPDTGRVWPAGPHVRSDDLACDDGQAIVYVGSEPVAGLLLSDGGATVRHAWWPGREWRDGTDTSALMLALVSVAQDYAREATEQ